jgi:hypothetical protein
MLVGAIVLVLGIAFWGSLLVAFRVYLVLPIRSRNDTLAMRMERVPIDLAEIPPDLAPIFLGVARDLAACGFVAVGHFYNHRPMARMSAQGWVSVWAGPDEMTTMQVIGAQVQVPGQPVRTDTTLVLRSNFPNRNDLTTSNSRTPGVFIRDPRVDAVAWPGMENFKLLWRLHQARLARFPGTDRPLPPPASARQAEAYLDQLHAQVMGVQVHGGYFTEDAAAGVYRRTIKGSFLMTWRLLWPWKGIRQREHARRLAQVLAKVEMGRPEDYPLIPPASRSAAAPEAGRWI